ncbi:TPA: hypothetical protein OTR37_001015 [Aeromonas dhakensis]|nr:hypothetical protein [Aeromonas dhakensis]
MVRYTRPPSPTWQATTRSAPTKHLSDQHGQMAVIKSQAYENKEIILTVKAILAVTDEGNEGASPLLDMTKVTRSTLADRPRNGAVRRELEPGSTAINPASRGTTSGEKSHTKGQKWYAPHAKATWGSGKLFGFAIEMSSHHQVKPNKNSRLLADLLS